MNRIIKRLERRPIPELSLKEPNALKHALGMLVTGQELGYVIRAPRKGWDRLPWVRRKHGRDAASQIIAYLEALGSQLSTEDEVPFAGTSLWHSDKLPQVADLKIPKDADPAMIAVWRAEKGVTRAQMTQGNATFWDYVGRRDPKRHPVWSVPEEVVDYLDIGVAHPWVDPVMHEAVLRTGDAVVFYLDGSHGPTLHRFARESLGPRLGVSAPYEVSAAALVAGSTAVGARP